MGLGLLRDRADSREQEEMEVTAGGTRSQQQLGRGSTRFTETNEIHERPQSADTHRHAQTRHRLGLEPGCSEKRRAVSVASLIQDWG